MKQFAAVLIAIFALACGQQSVTAPSAVTDLPVAGASGGSGIVTSAGFDQFGYNYGARLFVGPEDGADRNLDGTYWGNATYANDHLVMKWSKAWDNARFHGSPWTCDAWLDNEYNGRVPGGSGETAHYKIVWVGVALQNSPCWREGGTAIWGQFEVIMAQGTSGGAHFWETHATPAGYGGN